MPKPVENTLYYGDNLDVLRRYIKDETIDLIYLDPPFKSNQDYNVLFAEQSWQRSAAQIKAFEDTWRWDQGLALAFQETVGLPSELRTHKTGGTTTPVRSLHISWSADLRFAGRKSWEFCRSSGSRCPLNAH